MLPIEAIYGCICVHSQTFLLFFQSSKSKELLKNKDKQRKQLSSTQQAKGCSMKIRFHQEPTRGRQNKCVICGSIYSLKKARASIYSQHGIEYGDVCPECLESGSEGIKARLWENIQRLREFADELEALSREPMQLPGLEAEFKAYRNRSI